MSRPIPIIKTLAHLVPVHVAQAAHNVYATAYTPQILDYLQDLELVPKANLTFTKVKQVITNLELNRVKQVSAAGEFALTGDVVTLWLTGYAAPVRIEFFDEEVERVSYIDPVLGRPTRSVDYIIVPQHSPKLDVSDAQAIQIDCSGDHNVINGAIYVQFIPEIMPAPHKELVKPYDYTFPQLFWNRTDLLTREVERLVEHGYFVQVLSSHLDNLPQALLAAIEASHARELTADSIMHYLPPDLPAGFISANQKLAVFTDREILGTIFLSQRHMTTGNTAKLLRQLEGEISVGDYVVHADHGVGRYAGLTQEEVDGQLLEYIDLEYGGEDRLLVPLNQVAKLTKYIGNDGREPELDRLGKASWKQTQQKVKHSVLILAKELVEHYARRELATATAIPETDSAAYHEFVARFPYTETDDQLRSVNEAITDMQQSRPMNRLLVGDVGFGKTEVILRAAFKMAEAGKQVAILCPTTVLAAQHYVVFAARFKDTPYKVASLSRFQTAKENQKVVDAINAGEFQIVVGTHRLLSKDVRFAGLGLLVVDEEQRFGVKQKERIRQLNYGVHYLSVSATPIPRTLSMALSSIQQISIMTQAPKGRKPIHTELVRDDWNLINKAIHAEIERGGQIYFVHNHVRDLPGLTSQLEQLLPGIRIVVAHGQQSASSLDSAMTAFYQHHADVLLCTTIIENGLDMPNVNTMIINNAHRFGLSQLYQLRGRIGRADRQAFCYLFYQGKAVQQDEEQLDTAQKGGVRRYIERLQAIVDANELGAGFHVASRDLEIRGAGDMLGAKQSGHISKLGYALYMQLLAAEIEKLQAADTSSTPEYASL